MISLLVSDFRKISVSVPSIPVAVLGLLYSCRYKVKGGKTTMKDHEVEAGKIPRKCILREYFIKIYLFVFCY